jgi:hypothetical protein
VFFSVTKTETGFQRRATECVSSEAFLNSIDSLPFVKVHAKARRYLSPEEHAFFPKELEGIEPVMKSLTYPPVLAEQVEVPICCHVTLNSRSCHYQSLRCRKST